MDHSRSLVCLLGAALVITGCSRNQPPSLQGSSVLLITMDTTRADALGCYGGPEWVTPTLDALAARGVRFEQARATAPITLPSHTSILTGLYPFEHGVRDNATFFLAPEVDTLAERLARRGYSTAAVMGSLVLHSQFGTSQGFEYFSDVPRRSLEISPQDQRTAAEVVDVADALLGRLDPARPFFLWVHFFDPHAPYEPSERLLRSLPLAPDTDRNRYLAEVAAMDRQIGRLLAAVDRRFDLERVLLVATADHGEGLGEHDEPSHGICLYDSTMRVPLLFRHPALTPQVVAEPVSLVDLAPTLLSAVAEPGAGMTGRDLSPLLRGEGSRPAPTPLYMETLLPWYSHRWAPAYAVVQWPYKVTLGRTPHVHDLVRDPGEHSDLGRRAPDAMSRARHFLDELRPRTVESLRHSPSAADQRALRTLGYFTAPSTEDPAGPHPGWLPEGAGDSGGNRAELAAMRQVFSLWDSGQVGDAWRAVEPLVRQFPDDPSILLNAAGILSDLGRSREALTLLRRAVGDGQNPDANCSLALCLRDLGDLSESVKLLRKTARLAPGHLPTLLGLGEILVHLGEGKEAEFYLARFLRLFEGDEVVRGRVTALRQAARNAPG